MLEPYSEPRNVLYVIVSPDNDYVLSQAAVFVRELGVMYEQCRMGEHKPLTEKLRDGVLRIGKTNAERVASEPVDDWFRDIGRILMVIVVADLYSTCLRETCSSEALTT